MWSRSPTSRPANRFRVIAWCASLLVHAMILLAAWWLLAPALTFHHSSGERIFIPQPSRAIAVEQNKPAELIPQPRSPLPPRHALPLASESAPAAIPSFSDGRLASPEDSPLSTGAASAPAALPGIDTHRTFPFGSAPKPTPSPPASVLSVVGDAPSVVYVCDASGSMVGDRMAHLKVELRKAIAALRPIQAFTIIFFKQGRTQSFNARLVMANQQHKQQAYQFLDSVQVEDQGQTDPIIGMDQAFDARPAIIYLLTDGDFPDNAALEQLIARRNVEHKITINTVAFLGQDKAYESVLKKIAADNSGTFKQVTREELEKQATSSDN